ncbi:MAG: hypothetical protein D6739_08010 [Nitrospirae bacterium]|nr:MAG: hypothetical protein D6739_08010 [Nitrospirota bacterium]
MREWTAIAAFVFALALGVPGRAAAAGGSRGEVVFGDTLYGTAIGGIMGAAAWLVDQDHAGVKLGTGLLAGSAAGLVFGLTESRTFVEVDHGTVRVALPAPVPVAGRDGPGWRLALVRLPLP